MKQTIKTECFLVRLLFKTDTCRATLYWCLTGVKYAIPLLGVWIWKLILDELTLIYQTHAVSHVVGIYLSIYLVLQVVASVITHLNSVIYEKIERKATYHMDMAIMRKMTEIDTAFFDDPSNATKLKAANTSESYITGNMCWAVDTIIRLITFVSGMIVFLSYNPLLGFASFLVGAYSLVFASMRLRRYRDTALGGVISFRRALLFSMLIYFYAALLMAAAQFVYFQFIDHGFMLSQYAEITGTPEFKTMLSAYGMRPEDMKLAMDNLAALRPIDIALQFLSTNIILGLIVSLPIAAMMKSRYKRKF